MRPWLRFLRAPLAPTAACDVLACRLLAGGAGGAAALGWLEGALLALTSLLVYGFGMGLNDWADRERDRSLAPDRPLPSGALDPATALGALALLAAGALVWAGGPAGSRSVVATALALAALYNLVTKRWLVGGALTMGGVRAANAAIGVVPLVAAGVAPAWTLAAPLAIGCYSAAVTVLSTTEEQPSGARIGTARGLGALAFAAAGVVAALAAHRPTLVGVLALGTLASLVFGRVPKPGPVKRQVLEMLLGLYLLDAVLAGGSGSFVVEGVALLVAWALAIGSQLAVRALRPPAPVTPGTATAPVPFSDRDRPEHSDRRPPGA